MSDRPITIFYSWQSDLPNNKTRGFIESCIESAVKSLRNTVMVKAERDTDGVSGTPDIVQTIFSRIDNCDLFIADVSIVGMYNPEIKPERIKLVPNPNVMLELGYAAGVLGWENVLCFRNTDFGGKGEFPFDLEHRRLKGFSLEGKETSVVRKDIRDIIAQTVMDIYEKGPRARSGYAMHAVGSYNWVTKEVDRVLQPLDIHNVARCNEVKNGYLNDVKCLIEKISSFTVGNETVDIDVSSMQEQNPVMEEWMDTLRKERPVTLHADEIAYIKERVNALLGIALADSFFSVGNLRIIPWLMTFGDGKYLGTEDEIEKYNELRELEHLIHKIDRIDIFLDTFNDMVLLPLAIHNLSTVADENITVMLKISSDEVEGVIPSGKLFNEAYRSDGDIVGLEGFAYDENLPCMALLMPETADVQYDDDISYDIGDYEIENKRNIMQALGSVDIKSDVEDYEREICKYIASPLVEHVDTYQFTIESLRPNEKKWLGPLVVLHPANKHVTIEYSIRSSHSDGQISGRLDLN